MADLVSVEERGGDESVCERCEKSLNGSGDVIVVCSECAAPTRAWCRSDPALTVTFLSERGLLTWITHGDTAAVVTMRDDDGPKEYSGVVHVWQNDNGDDMLTVSEVLSEEMIAIMFLAAVERIDVL